MRTSGALFLTLSLCLGASPSWALDDLPETGDAVVTQFSGAKEFTASDGSRRWHIEADGVVARIFDLQVPVGGNDSQTARQQPLATAAQVGEIFGIATDDATPPNIYLSASAIHGLARADGGWMEGQWGPGGGPGSIWKLDAANGYLPELFANVTLDGRENSGVGLGNIAYDPHDRQLLVSDLETGMIHAIGIDDGLERDRFDHGLQARSGFVDVATGEVRALPVVEFDPDTSAQVDDCQIGPVVSTPQCWNIADFRRRVWGIAVRRDTRTGNVRVYYAVWSDTGLGNADFANAAPEEKTNAIWSVELDEAGQFKPMTAQREFLVPGGPVQEGQPSDRFAISDIAFPRTGEQRTMAIARNRGLIVNEFSPVTQSWPAFERPAYRSGEQQRWVLDDAGQWNPAAADDEPVGQAVVGASGRVASLPIGQDAAGGVDFGFGYRDGRLDMDAPAGIVWHSADNLCAGPASCEPESRQQAEVGLNAWLIPDIVLDTGETVPLGDIEIIAPYVAAEESQVAGEPDWTDRGEPEWTEGGRQDWWPGEAEDQGWWPPTPVTPGQAASVADLAVQKVAPNQCLPGKTCTIVLVITNVGGADYAASVRVTDDLPNAWALASSGPAGSPWACVQAGNQVACTHPQLNLAPGANEVLAFELAVPSAQVAGAINNCAIIQPGQGAIDSNQTNNQGCTQLIFNGAPPPAPDFDLAIAKEAGGECVAGQHCLFILRFTNTGTAGFDGILSYVDVLPANWKIGDIKPGWWCMLSVGGGDRFSCWKNAKLAPGQTEIAMFTAFPPAGFVGSAENCAELDWSKAVKDQRADNDRACARIDVNAPPSNDLSIDKRFGGQGDLPQAAAGSAFIGGCQQGTECAFDIVITNNGPGKFTDVITVVDQMPAGWKFAKSSPGWTCVMALGQPLFSCQKQAALDSGAQDVLTLNLIPNYGPAAVEVTNCISLDWSATKPDGDASNDRSCLPVQQAAGRPDLIIRKKGPEACERGKPCAFDIEVENIGSVAYQGALWLAEEDDDVFAIAGHTSSDDWICAARHRQTPAPGKEKDLQPGRIDCLLGQVDLAPGMKTRLHLDLIISELLEEQRTHYQNCVKFGADHDKDGIDEVGCHTIRLVPDWDLKIVKTAPSWCYGLKTDRCAYAYAVTNLGPGEYEGPVSIVDEYAAGIGLELGGWSPQSPNGWDCKVIKDGEWRCDHPSVKLKGGDSMNDVLKLVMDFTRDTPDSLEVISNRATVKYVGGPPDADPGNDVVTAKVIINHSTNRTVTGSTELCSAFDIILAIFGQGNTCYNPQITPNLDVNGDGTVECQGPACTYYEFTISNTGAMNYTGDMSLAVTLPEGARFLSAKGTKSGMACKADQWSCNFNANKAICTPGECILGSGEQTAVHFEVKLLPTPAPQIPAQGIEMTTCADLTWETPPPLNPIEQRPSETSVSSACRTTLVLPTMPQPCPDGQERNAAGLCVPVVKPLDLAVAKRTVGNCDGQENCRFQVTVSNRNNTPLSGRLTIRDTFSVAGAKLDRVSGRASCTQSGQTIDCVLEPGAVAAGYGQALSVLSFDMSLPRRGGNRSAQNCVEISRPGAGDLRLSRDDIQTLQRTLDQLGYDPGPIDGIMGRMTRDAANAAIADLNLAPGTQINRDLLSKLLGGGADPQDINPSNDRSCVSIVLPGCRPGFSYVRASGECFCPPPKVERGGECVVVAPPPPQPVVCENGFVDSSNQCICPSGWDRERLARDHYRCNPPQATVICEGGTVNSRNQCICPSGWDRERLARDHYRCNPPQATVICEGGTVNSRNQCICPSGWDRERLARDHYRCNPPQATVICEGGTVNSRNQCICPSGWDRERLARDHYRCNPPQTTVICEGGTVNSSNKCICPSGWDRERLARDHYRCNPPQATVICEGGTVNSSNKCVCPSGWDRERLARDHYRCNPPQATVICEGGRVNSRNQCICPSGWDRERIARGHFRCNPPQSPVPTPAPTPVPAQPKCIGGTIVHGLCVCPTGMTRIPLPNNAGFTCTKLQMIQPQGGGLAPIR